MDVVHKIGRRKTAVARVYLSEGKGNITVNKKDFKDAIIKRLNGSGDLLRNKINFDQIDYSKDKTINRQLKKNT